MCSVRARARNSFLRLGDCVVYYGLSMVVIMSLLLILNFLFDGGLFGHVPLL